MSEINQTEPFPGPERAPADGGGLRSASATPPQTPARESQVLIPHWNFGGMGGRPVEAATPHYTVGTTVLRPKGPEQEIGKCESRFESST